MSKENVLNPKGLSNLLLFSTVRIEAKKANGIQATGTGFFFDYPTSENSHIKLVITNKHLIKGAIATWFQLHKGVFYNDGVGPSGDFFTVYLPKSENKWITHPNEYIDLCALNFTGQEIEENPPEGRFMYFSSLQKEFILTDSELRQLRTIEDIIMVGYPNGLWDDASRYPLIRRGITASHPGINFKGHSEGVIDAACFPGSSGSPIFVFNEARYLDEGEEVSTDLTKRPILLGVLSNGPFIMNSRKKLLINLGYYIKAKEILTLAEHVKQVLQIN